MQDRNIAVMLVEDDDVDAESIVRAFKKNKIANRIVRVYDGIEALSVLRGSDGVTCLTQPFMILLDLNMPRMDGIEFLSELRQDPELSGSIVFVLTTSDDHQDKLAAYSKCIAGYILKSQVGEDFIRLTTMLECYWQAIQFPPDVTQYRAITSHKVGVGVEEN